MVFSFITNIAFVEALSETSTKQTASQNSLPQNSVKTPTTSYEKESQVTQNVQTKEKVNLKAKKVDFVNNPDGEKIIKASGDVEVRYLDYKLCSNTLTLDEKKDQITAKGDVILTGEQIGEFKSPEMRGNKAFTKASFDKFYFEKDVLYGNGKSARKDFDIIFLKDIRLSTCKNGKRPDESPYWSIKAKSGEYNVEKDEIELYNIFFYAKQMPIMWVPYFSISPSRNHGFLAPGYESWLGQSGISTPYFITEKSKTHYFLITPQFFFNTPFAEKKYPENQSKVSNLALSYDYNSGPNNGYFRYRIAPNAFKQLETEGVASDEKQNRYSFSAGLDFDYSLGNYGFNANAISDRFFRRTYLYIKDENYFTNNLFGNYFAKNNEQKLTLETVTFTPISFPETAENPKIDLYGTYTKEGKIVKNLTYYNTINTMIVSQEKSKINKRVSDIFGGYYKTKFGKIETTINPELRIDFYKKNYVNDIDPETGKITKKTGAWNDTARAIPSIYIENKIPIFFKLKNSNDFIFKFTPEVNVKLVRENIDNNEIENIDSSITSLNSNTILGRDRYSGFDKIDEGLNLIYGSRLGINHRKTQTKAELFVGQRATKTISKNKNFNFENYAGKVSFSTLGFFDSSTDFIVSRRNELLSASSAVSLDFKRFGVKFANLYINDTLLSNSTLNTNQNTYSAFLKLPELLATFNVSLVQNNNFKENDGRIVSKFITEEYSITSAPDCFEYTIGFKRERIANKDLEKGWVLFWNFRLLAI